MAADQQIAEILVGNRLTARKPDSQEEVSELFVNAVQPLLLSLGVSAEILEVYSPDRSSSCVQASGAQFILFDHGQLHAIELLDRLLIGNAEAFTVAAGFQRLFAEAARSAQDIGLYTFFILRAKEAVLNVPAVQSEEMRIARICHILLILFHEGAHALPDSHKLRTATLTHAALDIAVMSTELTMAVSGKLRDALRGVGVDAFDGLKSDLREWSSIRNDLKVSDEAISSTLHAIANDKRFHDEIACDHVAVRLHQIVLERERDSLTGNEYTAFSRNVLNTIYRGLLHLRLLKYLDDIFGNLSSHLEEDKINPLNLRSMVEVGFRGNLIAQLILSTALEIGGEDLAESMQGDLRATQLQHMTQLFEVVNRLLVMTILSTDFYDGLPGLLAEDGLPPESEWDQLEAYHLADSVWLSLVAKGDRKSEFDSLR